jgi:hypothetical protein
MAVGPDADSPGSRRRLSVREVRPRAQAEDGGERKRRREDDARVGSRSGIGQTHQFGWELRLTIGELVRTQVCRSSDEVMRVQEEWRRALEERGYAAASATLRLPR